MFPSDQEKSSGFNKLPKPAVSGQDLYFDIEGLDKILNPEEDLQDAPIENEYDDEYQDDKNINIFTTVKKKKINGKESFVVKFIDLPDDDILKKTRLKSITQELIDVNTQQYSYNLLKPSLLLNIFLNAEFLTLGLISTLPSKITSTA